MKVVTSVHSPVLLPPSFVTVYIIDNALRINEEVGSGGIYDMEISTHAYERRSCKANKGSGNIYIH